MLNPENEELEERSEEQKEPKIPTRGIFVFRIDPNKRGVAFNIFIAGILALVLFSVVINSNAQLNEVYSDISTANSQLNVLRSENVRMQTELESKASISNIKEYAENRLGMQKLHQSQIQYVDIQTEDAVTIEAEDQNIFVKIKHKFEDVVAYLRG